eukprot:scaffold616_cov306-Pavlova_lutheri.AAC.22
MLLPSALHLRSNHPLLVDPIGSPGAAFRVPSPYLGDRALLLPFPVTQLWTVSLLLAGLSWL